MKLLNLIEGAEIIHLQVSTFPNYYISVSFRLDNSVDIDEFLNSLYKITQAKRIHSVFDVSENRKTLDVKLFDFI